MAMTRAGVMLRVTREGGPPTAMRVCFFALRVVEEAGKSLAGRSQVLVLVLGEVYLAMAALR